jgi:hypothetical protein
LKDLDGQPGPDEPGAVRGYSVGPAFRCVS